MGGGMKAKVSIVWGVDEADRACEADDVDAAAAAVAFATAAPIAASAFSAVSANVYFSLSSSHYHRSCISSSIYYPCCRGRGSRGSLLLLQDMKLPPRSLRLQQQLRRHFRCRH